MTRQTTIKTHREFRECEVRALPSSDGPPATLDIVFSSDRAEVPRAFVIDGELVEGVEVLDHSDGAVNLDFLGAGRAPLLLDHDLSDQVGVIDNARVVEGEGRAKCRVSRSARAREVAQDVEDRIRRNASVGYEIDEIKIERRPGKPTLLRVTRWTPYEVSIVSVPADQTVGINPKRAGAEPTHSTRILWAEEEDVKRNKEGGTAVVINTQDAAPAASASRAAPAAERQQITQVDRDNMLAEERARINAINSLGASHQRRDLADAAVRNGIDLPTFKGILLDAMEEAKPLETPPNTIGLSDKEAARYSFVKLLRYLSKKPNERTQSDHESVRYELDCSNVVAERMQKKNGVQRGIFIPSEPLSQPFSEKAQRAIRQRNVGRHLRTMSAGAGTGGQLIGTDHLGASFIEVLYNSMQVRNLGATVLSGLVGNVQIPRRTAGGAVRWTAELVSAVTGANLNLGDSTFDQVPLQPRDITTTSMMSRRLLLQSDPSIEGLVRVDLAKQIALGVDLAATSGDNTADPNQPDGVFNIAGTNSIDMGTPNGGALTYAKAIEFITRVMQSNAMDLGGLGWLINANVWERANTISRDPGSGRFLMENNQFVSQPWAHSEQIPSNLVEGASGAVLNGAIFAAWSQMLIGEWGVLELQTDPYTAVASGAVRVNAFMTCDINVRHASAFSQSQDII